MTCCVGFRQGVFQLQMRCGAGDAFTKIHKGLNRKGFRRVGLVEAANKEMDVIQFQLHHESEDFQ